MRTDARRVNGVQATFVHVAADVFPFSFHFGFASAFFADKNHVGEWQRRVGRIPADDEIHTRDFIVMYVIPRQHSNAAATGRAMEIDLAGDAIEADEEVARGEGF